MLSRTLSLILFLLMKVFLLYTYVHARQYTFLAGKSKIKNEIYFSRIFFPFYFLWRPMQSRLSRGLRGADRRCLSGQGNTVIRCNSHRRFLSIFHLMVFFHPTITYSEVANRRLGVTAGHHRHHHYDGSLDSEGTLIGTTATARDRQSWLFGYVEQEETRQLTDFAACVTDEYA